MPHKIELNPENSCCKKHQKIIVSKDPGESRMHRALNPEGQFEIRHYRLDGDLVKNQSCCDFLLINDTTQKAYYIELKGRDIKKAVSQLLAGEALCQDSLVNYVSFYRIVASKSLTHNLRPQNYRQLLNKVGTERLKCRTEQMEETLKP